ncbi:MAG: murein L,D-transpeptidase catalytic domain family protein [Alphaproteobacteria bacterium]|nr:MAG: murein L,D-transpeptidase catalytic domain family protein [Alphaproteobacteria bacterium]
MKGIKFLLVAIGLTLFADRSAASAPTTACELAGIDCADFEIAELQAISDKARKALNTTWQRFGSDDTSFVVLFDAGQHSSQRRFFVVNRRTKEITSFLVAHGRGSDPDHDGWLDLFSDVAGSKATPHGAFRTAETYNGRHGYSLRLDGLEPHNKNARDRAIVIHGADYVTPGRNPIGRSWGCPALETSLARAVIDKIKGGALLVITD